MARSQVHNFASFVSITAFGTLFGYSRSLPDNDLRWINSLLPVPWLHGDIYLTLPNFILPRFARPLWDRVCLGTSGRRDHAFKFLDTSLPSWGKSLLFLMIDPVLIVAANCGPLLWPIKTMAS